MSALLGAYILIFFHFGLRITCHTAHNPAEPFQKIKIYTLVILESFIFLPFAIRRLNFKFTGFQGMGVFLGVILQDCANLFA